MSLTRDEIILAYRLFLDRVPSEAETDQMLARQSSLDGLRKTFLQSDEFRHANRMMQIPGARTTRDALYHYQCAFDAPALIARHVRGDLVPQPGLVTNFLGVMIPPKVFPPMLDKLSGQLEGPPDPGNWHADIAEWAAALLSVEQASDSYRIVELGCGWGCWLVNMGAAARARGLEVHLVGIEGDRTHLADAAEVLALNGFDPDAYSLHHGAAGPRPGKAIFPDPQAGTAAFRSKAVFYPDAETLSRAEQDPAVQVLDCVTLEELGSGHEIDLLHIDIQGAEAEFVLGNAAQIDRFARRVLIGTHGRALEGQLCDHFLTRGWVLEMERPAITALFEGKPVTRIDGVQMWANPALVPAGGDTREG